LYRLKIKILQIIGSIHPHVMQNVIKTTDERGFQAMKSINQFFVRHIENCATFLYAFFL
jgi:hypothetical protein